MGVWLSLERKREEDGVPDMVTVLKVDNEFHTGYRFIFYDGWIHASQETGSCKVGNESGEITFRITEPSSKTYYGIFEVTEGDRAKLKLEYRQGSKDLRIFPMLPSISSYAHRECPVIRWPSTSRNCPQSSRCNAHSSANASCTLRRIVQCQTGSYFSCSCVCLVLLNSV